MDTIVVAESRVEPSRAPGPDTDRAAVAHLRPPTYIGSRHRSKAKSWALRALVPSLIFVYWWYGSANGWIDEKILASPADVWGAFDEILSSGQLSEFLGASLQRLAIGLACGVVIGVALGVIAGLWQIGDELIDSTVQMVRAVPVVALAPLMIVWFGIGETFKVVLISLAAAVPMYTYAYLGVRNIDRKLIESAQSFGCRGRRLVTTVILPTAWPNILMGLRIALVTTLIALIVAEQVGADAGIGYLFVLAQQYYRQDYMMLCILLYAALGLTFDVAIRALERVTMPWRKHATVR